ncbi:MAG: phosphoglucosamine mutase [Veillonellaceae bacterium]|nr:phosphoglucosamine mutase [Veillonellaceae bacterium]
MARLFGTDGIRGIVNDSLTPELTFRLGQAAALYFAARSGTPAKFLIGRDTRISGSMLTASLAAGICSVGGEAHLAGVMPTPAVAFLTKRHGYTAGVVISASHNPYPDNGIKFFDGDGFKLPDETEDEIEEYLRYEVPDTVRPTGAGIGRVYAQPAMLEEYMEHIVQTAPNRLDGLRIVTDTANGAASQVTPEVLRRLGAEVIPMANLPDGVNINDGCGSTHPEALAARVVAEGAHAGIANDGDADRCLLVDETGAVVDGDRILYLCARELKTEGKLAKDTVVATVMSNIGFGKSLAEAGITPVYTAVGDRYVLQRMRAEGYVLGGEQSGHVIFLDYNTTGDGVLTAVQVLSVLQRAGVSMSELASAMPTYPQLLRNVSVYDKQAWAENPFILAAISAGEEELGDDGRILVRASGTESLIRVMAEGADEAQIERIVADIVQVIERELGRPTE